MKKSELDKLYRAIGIYFILSISFMAFGFALTAGLIKRAAKEDNASVMTAIQKQNFMIEDRIVDKLVYFENKAYYFERSLTQLKIQCQ